MRITMSLKEAAPQVVPQGIYTCEVTEVKDLRTIETQDGPKEVVDLRWKVLDGTTAEASGRTILDTYWFDEKSLWRVALLFQQVLGLKKDELPDLQTTEEIHDYMQSNLIGAKATLQIDVVLKDEVERNRIKKITGIA